MITKNEVKVLTEFGFVFFAEGLGTAWFISPEHPTVVLRRDARDEWFVLHKDDEEPPAYWLSFGECIRTLQRL